MPLNIYATMNLISGRRKEKLMDNAKEKNHFITTLLGKLKKFKNIFMLRPGTFPL